VGFFIVEEMMLSLNMPFPIFFLIVALTVTIYVMIAKNPFEKGAKEYQSLRLCRAGLTLLVWSIGFWAIGTALSLVALILGIIGAARGRTLYGIILIIGSVVLEVSRLIFFPLISTSV
jgi:predicted lysophospholipase L1 biosynthesis ABC-type transport system permease subunit